MAEISQVNACLLEKIGTVRSTPASIQNIETEILSLRDDLKKEEENIQIAQDRVRMIRYPNEDASYYESWFPLGRPLQPALVPIFFGIAIFLFTVCGLILLSILGIDIAIFLPRASPYGGSFYGWRAWAAANLRWPFWVALAAIIGVVVYYRK